MAANEGAVTYIARGRAQRHLLFSFLPFRPPPFRSFLPSLPVLMAIIVPSLHARNFQRRNIQDGHLARAVLETRDIAQTEDGEPVATVLPTSVKVLTAFFVILGVLILGECFPRTASRARIRIVTWDTSSRAGIITWRIVVWRRRKAFTASQKYRQGGGFSPSEKIRPIVDSTPVEKQEVLVILPMEPPPTAQFQDTKWKPQIFSHNNTKSDASNVVDIKVPLMAEAARSPPPTYDPSSPPPPPPSPPPPALNLPTVTVTHEENRSNSNNLAVPATPSVVVSPRRTSSFGLETPAGLGEGASLRAKPSVKGQKLPRKMLVEHTFVPTLADELAIKVGEVILMLEEYEDEWCLVERVGKNAGDRGVIPRFCLCERPRGHRRGASSASGASAATMKSGTSTRAQ